MARTGDPSLTTVDLIRRLMTPGARHPWEPESTRANRQRRVLPFLVLVVVSLAVAALPPGEPGRFVWLGVALVGFAVCAALIVLVPWERLPDWPRLGIVVLYCADVAVVRDATGGGHSGYATMLLLVVVWQAAYGSRVQMGVTLTLTALTVVIPILAVGGADYPASEWRKALVFTLVAGVVGTVVHELVRRTSQERWIVGRVAGLGEADRGDAPPTQVSQLALELTGADVALVLEPEGDGVRVTGRAGRAIAVDEGPADAVVGGLGAPTVARRTGVGRGGTTTIELVVAWDRPRRRVPAAATFALPLLAAEAATLIDRAALVDRLEAMTREDPLTGLLNRRAWDDHLIREIARVARTGRPLSVALLDLDRFKAFNDTHGHLVGDQLLKAATSAWTGVMRTSDVLARWGGEEFVVLMPETGPADARRVLTRMARRTPMGQTFSAGVVTVTTAVDPDALLAAADDAVYRAKDLGRDRIEVADAPVDTTPVVTID